MPRTEYVNDTFELIIESANPVHLLPPDPKERFANELILVLARLRTEAGLDRFRAVDKGGGVYDVDAFHGAGRYQDTGDLSGGGNVPQITWPALPIGPYPLDHLKALMEIRLEMVGLLRRFEPTLIDVKFL